MDRVEPLSTSEMDITEGGIIVKGETKALEGVFFEPEEKVVEKEIKRKLTKTPEEFVAAEQKDTQGKSRYFIKKTLLGKQGRKYNGLYMCPGCQKRKKLRLVRVDGTEDSPGIAGYVLLCGSCRKQRAEKRQEERKKANRKWRRRYVKGGGLSKISFYNKIRKQIFERDGHKCVLCEALGRKNYEGGSGLVPGLGLAPLIPESKGGEQCFDNYAVSCAFHRASKGNELPLNYIFEKLTFEYYLTEQLDDEPVVKNPGARASVNMHLVAEIQQYLYRIAGGVEIDRSKAERLAIKLSETDEDRKREREQILW